MLSTRGDVVAQDFPLDPAQRGLRRRDLVTASMAVAGGGRLFLDAGMKKAGYTARPLT
jgi:hypothetical protein